MKMPRQRRSRKLSPKRQYRASFIGLIWLALASVFQTILIFGVYFNSPRSLELLTTKPFIGLFSVIILLGLNLLLSGALNRLIPSLTITTIIIILALGVNFVKMQSRNLPLLPDDLNLAFEAGDMAKLVSVNLIFNLIMGLLITLVLAFWLNRQFKKQTQTKFLWAPLARPIIIALALFILLPFNRYVKNPKFFIETSPLLNVKFATWNQEDNYYEIGPIIGFYYNIGKPQITKPENYSQAKVLSIVKKYQTIAAAQSDQISSDIPDDLTVIYLQSESFTDPQKFKDYYPLNRDPIPFTRQIMNKSSTGNLYISEYGGGTANIEFEALTGFTSVFDFGTSFYNSIISKSPGFPSIAQDFNHQGYPTLAIHDYKQTMYKRFLVYPNLGFTQFIDSSRMQFTDKIERSDYISDQQFYRQLTHELDQVKGPSFTLAISMQNHAPYKDVYDIDQPYAQTTNPNSEAANIFENYVQGLNYSDQALKELISYIDSSSKKIMLVFWGDHLPADGIYSELRDSQSKLAYQMPFFIYNNFELPTEPVGDISPNYINLLLSRRLNLKLTPFETLIADVQSSYPILTINTNLKDRTQSLIDFQTIQYDMLAGEKFSQKQNFFN